MTAETIRKICIWCYAGVAIVAFVFLFFVIFVLGNRGPVIKYGGPGSIKIVSATTEQPVLSSGEPADICFSDLQWLRRCDTVVLQQLEVGGVVYNLPVHRVSPSPHPNKCRPMGVLTFPRNFAGDVKFSGTAISTCWWTDRIWPLETALPDAHFTVKSEDPAKPIQ